MILDPADPTGNLGGGHAQSWPRLAREAEVWLSYPCFKNADGSPVGYWDIEVSPSAFSLSSFPTATHTPPHSLGYAAEGHSFQRNCLLLEVTHIHIVSGYAPYLTLFREFLEFLHSLSKVHSLVGAAMAGGHFFLTAPVGSFP